MSASEIVNKVWNYAHVLRDDGVGYGDYVEQITFLIFLKIGLVLPLVQKILVALLIITRLIMRWPLKHLVILGLAPVWPKVSA